jgi:copper transport protein
MARQAQRAVLRTFSGVATIGLAAVLVTGLLLSGAEVSTVTSMLSTWYGAFLVAKLLLVGVVMLIAWRNRRALKRRVMRSPMRTIVAEATVGAVIIGLGAALAASLPARGPQFSPPAPVQPATLTANAADLLVQVSLEPNRPGTNLLTAVVSNTRRPVPAPITGVTLQLSSPYFPTQTVKTTQAADGSWSGGQLNLVPGATTIVATVHRPGLPDASVSIPFIVNVAPAWHQPKVLSTARWTPIAEWAAVFIVTVSLLAAWVGRRRAVRRRRRSAAQTALIAPDPPLPLAPAAVPAGSTARS